MVLEGNIIWPKTLRMLKFHPITAFMKMHANFHKGFWFKYIFPVKYNIRISDLMLLPKNSVTFEGLYYRSDSTAIIWASTQENLI